MKKYYINGKTFLGSHTGIYRYAANILIRLDQLLENKTEIKLSIILPENTDCELRGKLRNVTIIHYGKIPFGSLTLWQNLMYARKVKGDHAIAFSFANFMPFTIRKGVVVVHDIMALTHPEWYAKKHFLKTYLMLQHVFRCSGIKLITVSEHTRDEIQRYCHRNMADRFLGVVPSAWSHLKDFEEDDSIVPDDVKDKTYIFSMCGAGMSRNFPWLYAFAKRHPELELLIGGMRETDTCVERRKEQNNIRYLGFVSDEQLIALYKHCKAYIYVSLEEGFGLTPLEALACGAEVVCSDIAVFKEIYKDSVHYVGTKYADQKLDDILSTEVWGRKKVLEEYTWENAAKKLVKLL